MRLRSSALPTFPLLAALSLTAFGCARGPDVSADGLALRRVVIYRNGVGYFERAGRVEDEKVEFKVRAEQVGDFLASLAIIEEGGSSVRSASFPIKLEKDDVEPEPPEEPPMPFGDRARRPGLPPQPPKPAPKKKKNDRETVVLELDGKRHDLQVGYIAATPVWRPTYRLVIDEKGADLQSWGIVQNLSGEDWKNVSLSLVAGAPIAFQATLGTPVIPERPVVTDAGEVIAAVPRSETSLAEAPPPPPSPREEEQSYGYSFDTGALSDLAEGQTLGGIGLSGMGAGGAQRSAMKKAEAAPAAPMPASAPAHRPNPSMPRNLSALAAVAVEAGATRYDLPTPITVPDKSATMVMLLSKRVPGEAIFLFAPDGGVPESFAHPFRVARFTNQSGGLLERGPIAVFEKGAFLGQGMVDPLPDGATATVPFALERSLAVDEEKSSDETGARLAKIESGRLTIERDGVTRTKYRVRNGGPLPAKVLVKHGRAWQTRLHEPPKGTEDNVGTGTALVPVEVGPRATGELIVDERRPMTVIADWLSPLADDAVRAYIADAKADEVVVKQLEEAWKIREVLVRATDARRALTDEQTELSRATQETRRNLSVLEKNPTAADLRQRLTQRLAEASRRLDEITKRLIELDMSINEQRVRFQDAVRAIKVSKPS